MSACTSPTKARRYELVDWADLIAIGSIAKPQGREGEVAVNPLTDQPERFVELRRVFLEGANGAPLPYAIESARLHKGRPVVKLAGIRDIGDARALAGKQMRIPRAELSSLPEGTFYHFQISGLQVIDNKQGFLGVAEDVMTTGGTDVLIVRSIDGEELLVPFCAEICRHVDLEAGRIEVEAPEGLLDLNAN